MRVKRGIEAHVKLCKCKLTYTQTHRHTGSRAHLERVLDGGHDPLLAHDENEDGEEYDLHCPPAKEPPSDVRAAREVELVAQRRRQHEEVHVVDGEVVRVADEL